MQLHVGCGCSMGSFMRVGSSFMWSLLPTLAPATSASWSITSDQSQPLDALEQVPVDESGASADVMAGAAR